jgi:hypothetical protein
MIWQLFTSVHRFFYFFIVRGSMPNRGAENEFVNMALLKRNKLSTKFPLLHIEKEGNKLTLIVGPSFAVMMIALVSAVSNRGSLGNLGVLLSGGGLVLIAQLLGRWWNRG